MPQKHCVLSATANERPPALRVVAWAKSPPLVFHSVTAKNAAELADTAATFVVVRAKSNLEIHNGSLRRRPKRPPVFVSNSGSLAMFAAMRRAQKMCRFWQLDAGETLRRAGKRSGVKRGQTLDANTS